VRLVSIVELLLTHQPDFARFNVEDSITKQFVLKTAILAQQQNPNIDLEHIKAKLKTVYAQRSNIVHGNFHQINRLLKKGESFETLVSDSYDFARIVLDAHLRHPQFVKFLKEN